MRSRRSFFTSATTLALLGLAGVAWAIGAGDLDPAFGTGGIVLTQNALSGPHDVQVQGDGSIVVCGGENNAWRLRRYLDDGTLDTGFGVGGAVVLFDDVVVSSNNRAWDLALDVNGRILALGQAYVKVTTGTGKKAKTTIVGTCALVRLNADGSLDTTFGSGGKALLFLANQQLSIGNAVAVRPDGRVVVSGRVILPAGGNSSQSAVFVARFLATGALDTSFGSGGTTIHDPTNKDDMVLPHSMGLQSDGRIVVGTRVGGTTGTGLWTITRFLAGGALDSSFSVSDPGRALNRIAIDASDRIVAVGKTASLNDVLVARYLANGAVDTSFGTGGSTSILSSPWGGGIGPGLDPLLRADGKILVSVQIDPGDWVESTTVRFLDDGTLDGAYGTGGFGSPVSFASAAAQLFSAGLAPDGATLLAGFRPGVSPQEWFLARYVGD